MTVRAVLGVDVGTSSSKGVIVDASGRILASAVREHEVSRPAPGHVEMDPRLWWREFLELTRELTSLSDASIEAVGVSGMGPCLAVTDEHDEPLRPAILYGVDMRATQQIDRLTRELGDAEIRARCGSGLSTQSVGPKIQWLRDNEPEVADRARRFFMPSSWLVRQLTGEYVLDYHSASQCTPLFDAERLEWYQPWTELIAPQIEFPRLLWSAEVAGVVTSAAASLTGLRAGIPVIAGTIDAWSEAASVGATSPGDLMLMYGSTMFLIDTVDQPLSSPTLWSTVGTAPGTRNLAGGMASSGTITAWLRKLLDEDFASLIGKAEASPPGASGLLMLPYFAGERTPIADPDARGAIIGLTLDHDAGDLYRAALEATAFGVRHNVEALEQAGASITRTVAVGGGTKSDLWAQIVSDVTGLEQSISTITIGASYGAAFFAAEQLGAVSIADWNRVDHVITPREEFSDHYDSLYKLYREFYPATSEIAHALARLQVAERRIAV